MVVVVVEGGVGEVGCGVVVVVVVVDLAIVVPVM